MERVRLTGTVNDKGQWIPPPGWNTKGRPPGTRNKNKVLLERLMQYKKSGELPHEFMLRVVRGEAIKQGKDKTTGETLYYTPTFQERMEAAKASAAFFAPRLSTVEVVKGLSDEVLDNMLINAAAQAGVLLDFTATVNEAGETIFAVEEDTGENDE